MSEWWRDFFDKDYMDIYGPVDAEKTAVEVEGIDKILKLQKGSKVLDLCCGYGRHSIGLARNGFNVTGFDFSAVLLEKALTTTRCMETTLISMMKKTMMPPTTGRK